MGEHVTTRPEAKCARARTQTSQLSGGLQRNCACGNQTMAGTECATCSHKHESVLQREAAQSAGVAQVPPIVHEVLKSPGQPLDTEARAFFERRFGQDLSRVRLRTPVVQSRLKVGQAGDDYEREAERIAQSVAGPTIRPNQSHVDFSKVRVHTGPRAAESASAVNSNAYTISTLDNAESYALLADLLHNRKTEQVVKSQTDKTPGCSQPDLVLNAFARAAQWNRFAEQMLKTFLDTNKPLSSLKSSNPELSRLPEITTRPQLESLHAAFARLGKDGFGVRETLGCVESSPNCGEGVLGFAKNGSVTKSGVNMVRLQPPAPVTLCQDWFDREADCQIRSIYAVFMLGRIAGIVNGFQLDKAYKYIDFAQEVVDQEAPPPTTRSAVEHLQADVPVTPLRGERPVPPTP